MDDDEAVGAPPPPSERELEAVVDLAGVGAALRRVREHRRLSLRGMQQYLAGLTDRPQDRWSKTKIEQAEKGQQLEERWLLRYLSAAGVPGPALPPWVMALRRAQGASPPPAPAPPAARAGLGVSNLPPRNRVFVGREPLLDALHAGLRDDGISAVLGGDAGAIVGVAAVHGLGGVGKTELVREFAHRFGGEYDLIWWIPAERPTTVVASLAALAHPLEVPESPDQAETIAAVFAALRDPERGRWLLVYDNAEHPDALAGLVPPTGAGHVLVTSRWSAWSETAEPVRLEVFDRAESRSYLAHRAPGTAPEVLDELAALLGDLPLALAEAAAYLEHTRVSAEAYLGLLRERAGDLFGLDLGSADAMPWLGDQRRVATVWSLSLERVHELAPHAEALLTLLAYLGPDDVPRDLVAAHSEALPDDLAAVTGDPLRYNHLLAALGRYSMITLAPDTVGVHRLVQAVVRARLDAGATRRWAATATALLRAAFPDDVSEPAVWPFCARMLPHVLTVTEHAEALGVALEDAGWLLDRAAKYLRQRGGQFTRALPLVRRALADTVTAVGAESPEAAERHDELGRVLDETGDPVASRRESEEAVRIGVAVLGPDHPDVGRWRNTLGRGLWRLGETAAARREWEESLRVGVRSLGPDHPEIGRRRNNLGLALWSLGELSSARREGEEALRINLVTLGPDHPAVSDCRNNLGLVLRELGEPDAARREVQEALRISLAASGPDHPRVGSWRDSLGLILRDLGELPAARRELEEAVRIGLTALGPDHPELALWRGTLGSILLDVGEPAEAARELAEALRISVAALGPDHPQTERARTQLLGLEL